VYPDGKVAIIGEPPDGSTSQVGLIEHTAFHSAGTHWFAYLVTWS
jgi:hypothetical protein